MIWTFSDFVACYCKESKMDFIICYPEVNLLAKLKSFSPPDFTGSTYKCEQILSFSVLEVPQIPQACWPAQK